MTSAAYEDEDAAAVIQGTFVPSATRAKPPVSASLQPRGEYRLKSESPGRLIPVLYKEKDVAERDEKSTTRKRSDSDYSRDPAPVDSVSGNRKRRATDSFDIEDSGTFVDDETELVRVTASAKPKSVSREDSLEDEPSSKASRRFSFETSLAKPELSLCVDEVDDDIPLTRLENVTAQSRSLIPPELLKPPRPKRTIPLVSVSRLQKNKMATAVTTSSNNNMSTGSNSGRFRRKISGLNKTKKDKPENRDEDDDAAPPPRPVNKHHASGDRGPSGPQESTQQRRSGRPPSPNDEPAMSRAKSLNEVPEIMTVGSEETPVKSNRSGRSQSPPPESRGRARPGLVERIRSASRSRSRSRSRREMESHEDGKSILIAVTSCKSDAYHNQKAPGSTSKLPRKAPSNLKLFHELAVGVKDAYVAAGETPTRPDPEEWSKHMSKKEIAGRTVLWEFLGNLDFVSISSLFCCCWNRTRYSNFSNIFPFLCLATAPCSCGRGCY